MMRYLLSSNHIRRCEQEYLEPMHGKKTLYDMMQEAGTAFVKAFESILQTKKPVLVLAGPGNNGGDGFVIARLLIEKGWDVELAEDSDFEGRQGESLKAKKCFPKESIDLSVVSCTKGKVIIDALFGFGFDRPLTGKYLNIAKIINASNALVFAVDMPTGIDSDNGAVLGEVAILGDYTITFGYPKIGQYILPGLSHCGELKIVPMAFADLPFEAESSDLLINVPDIWEKYLRKATLEDTKYSRGCVAIIAGEEYPGAIQLTAQAARRIGCGYVLIYAPLAKLALYQCMLPGCVIRAYEDYNSLLDLLKIEKKITHITCGPGISETKRLKSFIVKLLNFSELAGLSLLLDAASLTCFAQDSKKLLSHLHEGVILVPHMGEFTQLFSEFGWKTKQDILKNISFFNKGIWLFKGSDSLMLQKGRFSIAEKSSKNLATAGSGDVLAGMVSGLVGQMDPNLPIGDRLFNALCAGVWLHTQAARRKQGTLIAEDLLDLISMEASLQYN